MGDILDQADKHIEYVLREALSKSKMPEPSKVHTGYCWFCESPLEAPKRWCDAECRDNWQKEQV